MKRWEEDGEGVPSTRNAEWSKRPEWCCKGGEVGVKWFVGGGGEEGGAMVETWRGGGEGWRGGGESWRVGVTSVE